MAAKRTFRMFVEEELGEFPHFVVWAVLEWTLIVSLYLDGFFSFLSNKFANTFELDPPCILCTRVDHALGGKNPNSFYNESICDSHKKDISSLAYCHVHRKLSDIQNMCEGCLLSFAAERDQSDDDDVKADDDDQKTISKPVKDPNKNERSAVDTTRCSCCGESLKPKQPSKELSRSFSNLRASSLLPTNSPRASGWKPTNSPRASFATSSPRVSSSLFPTSSPRASSSLFATSSPRVSSTSLFPTSSPRASSSLIPTSSPRESSSLLLTSSPRASSSLFPASSPRVSSSLFPTSSPRASWRIDEGRNSELCQARYSELKFASDNEPDMPDDEHRLNTNGKQIKDSKPDYEEMNEEFIKTPSYIRGNNFFGIPLNESIAGSPRWANKPPKKAPLDKPELVSETVDDPSTNDGCSILQQLKKQVSDNRKTLVTLYMELDEERSAAAVAANNAMAMITRLQAEKAAIHMEALQYQRMMDEQAEYDEEAIQILRDLYLKKEDDVKAMEVEVDAYRERYGELSKVDSDEYDEYYDEFQHRSESESLTEDQNEEGASLSFETERSQLFGMLKHFENRVYLSSQQKDYEDQDHTGKWNNTMLRKEVTLMREKLAAIEAESGFLKQTAMALEKGDQGTKLLTEIAEHLRNLHASD